MSPLEKRAESREVSKKVITTKICQDKEYFLKKVNFYDLAIQSKKHEIKRLNALRKEALKAWGEFVGGVE